MCQNTSELACTARPAQSHCVWRNEILMAVLTYAQHFRLLLIVQVPLGQGRVPFLPRPLYWAGFGGGQVKMSPCAGVQADRTRHPRLDPSLSSWLRPSTHRHPRGQTEREGERERERQRRRQRDTKRPCMPAFLSSLSPFAIPLFPQPTSFFLFFLFFLSFLRSFVPFFLLVGR